MGSLLAGTINPQRRIVEMKLVIFEDNHGDVAKTLVHTLEVAKIAIRPHFIDYRLLNRNDLVLRDGHGNRIGVCRLAGN